MGIQSALKVAAVIAAYQQTGKLVTRTRLQKSIKLLRRLGMDTDYVYTLHFYGPYSESLQAEVNYLGSLKVIEEVPQQRTSDGSTYYRLKFIGEVELPDISKFSHSIEILKEYSTEVLELAATYD